MRHSPILLFAVVAAVFSCGDDPSSPPQPTSLEIVSGDNQAGLPGTELAESLAVRVLGPGGSPLSGFSVSWIVVSGGGQVSPATSVSGQDGIARTRVTLGSTVGTSLINATVEGLAPVSFAVEILDPCQVAVNYTLGTTVSGTLATTDCRDGDGFFNDFYILSLSAPSALTIQQKSVAFDAFTFLLNTSLLPVAFDDDSVPGVNTNSFLRVFLLGGDHVMGASSFNAGEIGPYTLNAVASSFEIGPCEVPWVEVGLISIAQSLDAVICPTPDDLTTTADHFFLYVPAGRNTILEMMATSFTARITLFDGSGVLVQSSTATGPGAMASLTFQPSALAGFVVQMGSASGTDSGSYTFSVR